MSMLSSIYEKLLHRQAPPWLLRSGPLMLCWRLLRKWLCASVIPFIPLNWMRILGYRLVGIKIGRRVFIGMHCYLDDMHPDRMIIEDDVTISFRVTTACHGPRSCDNRLVLREGCYIGCNATLLGGLPRGDIEIGPYATVGACSLVNRSVPPLATVIGLPAKIVRTIRTPWGSDNDKTEALARKYLTEPAPSPRIDPPGGQFPEPVTVTIGCGSDDSGFIHYTSDGTEPTEDSTRYNASFRIDRTTVIKARVFKAGHLPSEVVSATITIA